MNTLFVEESFLFTYKITMILSMIIDTPMPTICFWICIDTDCMQAHLKASCIIYLFFYYYYRKLLGPVD